MSSGSLDISDCCKRRNLRCFSLTRDSKNLSDSAPYTNNARRLGNLLKEESLELVSKLILPEIIRLLNNFWFSGILLHLGNITDSDSSSGDDIERWRNFADETREFN
jgi:hypothetical protein